MNHRGTIHRCASWNSQVLDIGTGCSAKITDNRNEVTKTFLYELASQKVKFALRSRLKGGTQRKVLDGVASDNHLRESHDMCPSTCSLTRSIKANLSVSSEVSDGWIHLG
jgi:hypothetical protein